MKNYKRENEDFVKVKNDEIMKGKMKYLREGK